jgi:hypothetical protein
MSRCSFLSTIEKETECFGECAFYNWEENGGVCPFRNLTGNRLGRFKDLFQFNLFSEDTLNAKEIEEYYVEEEYI